MEKQQTLHRLWELCEFLPIIILVLFSTQVGRLVQVTIISTTATLHFLHRVTQPPAPYRMLLK